MPIDIREFDDGLFPAPPCPRCKGERHVSLDKGKVVRMQERRRLLGKATVKCSRCGYIYSYDTRTGAAFT